MMKTIVATKTENLPRPGVPLGDRPPVHKIREAGAVRAACNVLNPLFFTTDNSKVECEGCRRWSSNG
jgi:hypothetical protein